MDQEVIEALTEIFREEISKKNSIEIEGLGTFKHEHIRQYQQQFESGKVVMMPPRDEIKFIPENHKADHDDH